MGFRILYCSCILWPLLMASILRISKGYPDVSHVLNHGDLRKAMVNTLGEGGDSCVLLLHSHGTVGCSPSSSFFREDGPVEGPIVYVNSLDALDLIPRGAVALIPSTKAGKFLRYIHSHKEIRNSLLGVMIEYSEIFPGWNSASRTGFLKIDSSGNDFKNSDESFTSDHEWNPYGMDLDSLSFPFPIFQLDNVSSSIAVKESAQLLSTPNSRKSNGIYSARIHFSMEGQKNATHCLEKGACLPLGGFSVLSLFPPLSEEELDSINESNSPSAIWVVSNIDASALFHELSVGADAPLSGLIAMLAAARTLGSLYKKKLSSGNLQKSDIFRKHIIFAGLMGEPWGNMGSRRLLWELYSNSSHLTGFNISSADALLEIGQVGNAVKYEEGSSMAKENSHSASRGKSKALKLFLHSSSRTEMTRAQLERLDNLQNTIKLSGNDCKSVSELVIEDAGFNIQKFPPPASSEAFLRIRSNLTALAITEFNDTFTNAAYHSIYDNIKNIDISSIVSSSELISRTLYRLSTAASGLENLEASAFEEAADLEIDIAALEKRIKSLTECILSTDFRLDCPLAKRIMNSAQISSKRSNYVGILRSLPQDPQVPDLELHSNIERFIFSYLAFSTAPDVPDDFDEDLDIDQNSNTNSDSNSLGEKQSQDMYTVLDDFASTRLTYRGSIDNKTTCKLSNAMDCPRGTVCVGNMDSADSKGMGLCITATVRYVASYSLSFECPGCNGTSSDWHVTDKTESWSQQFGWGKDPMWTESNWPLGTPMLEMFYRDDEDLERTVFMIGILVTTVSVICSMFTHYSWNQRQKLE